MGPGSCTAATASSRRVQRAITRPDRSSRGLFMRVRRRSGQLYCRQRHHCVATNPPQHRTIACTRDTYRSLQTFSTLLGSRNLQSTLAILSHRPQASQLAVRLDPPPADRSILQQQQQITAGSRSGPSPAQLESMEYLCTCNSPIQQGIESDRGLDGVSTSRQLSAVLRQGRSSLRGRAECEADRLRYD